MAAQSTDFGVWEREVLKGIGEVMEPEVGVLVVGHKKGCVRRQLGLRGVAGPAWGRE